MKIKKKRKGTAMEKKIDEKKEITFENVDISISVNAQGKSEFDNVTKKNTKRRKVMTTAVAAISSVALLATATYAWFVLTNRPTVTQMEMKAGTSGNLQISLDNNANNFGTNITFTFTENEQAFIPVLKPLASKDGKTFHVPTYNNLGVVTGVNSTAISETTNSNYFNNTEANGGQLIKKEFYLKGVATDGTETIGIRLMGKYDNTASDYTKIFDVTGGNADNTAAESVRISFVYTDSNNQTTVTVLEPNANYSSAVEDSELDENSIYKKTITGQYNPYTTASGGIGTITYNTVRQSTNYLFQAGVASNQVTEASDYATPYSPVLFTIPTNTACKVTMYMWLEGTDSNCTNAAEGDSLKTQLMFFSSDLQ